jgi:type IV secretion system protein VirB1
MTAESSLNPHAIGVVGGALTRQPRGRHEALAAAAALEAQSMDYSVGLAQINVRNVRRMGLSVDQAFDPCTNLRAMQFLLGDCYARASSKEPVRQLALRRALSCYYSGNFVRGFRDGYVTRVVRAAFTPANPSTRHQGTP